MNARSILARCSLALLLPLAGCFPQEWAFPGLSSPGPMPAPGMAEVKVDGFDARRYDFQRGPVWCWAAATAAALQSMGQPVDQVQVVAAVYPNIEHRALPSIEMLRPLVNQSDLRLMFTPLARVISHEGFVQEIEAGNLFLVQYMTGPMSGHVVVVYGGGLNQAREVEYYLVWDPNRIGFTRVWAPQINHANPSFMILKPR